LQSERTALRGFAPDIGTNVNFLGSVFLSSTLKKSYEIIKEIWDHWACFRVVDLFALKLLSILGGWIFICLAVRIYHKQ
jgi:hypothetical protein